MPSSKLSVGLHWLFILNLLVASTTIDGADVARSTRATIFGENLPVHTEYVDRNNQTILAMFNLTDAQRHRLGVGNNASVEESTPIRENDHLRTVKEHRINLIRDRLKSAFGRNEQSQHEMAVYPLCNSELKISNWQDEMNLTMKFSHTFLDMKRENNLDSAILRLYKVNPEEDSSAEQEAEPTTTMFYSQQQQAAIGAQIENCSTPMLEKQIRITVSVIQQHRRNKRAERKKRICNTLMMNASKTGWIEIDIKRAIYIWEEGRGPSPSEIARQVLVGLLMIEVHDEEERPLRPGLYFQPPNCEQADFPIPWNYYGSRSTLPALQVNDVPKFPRIDVKLTGYASFAPKNFNSKSSQQLRQQFQLQLYNLANAEGRGEQTNEQTQNNQESNTPYNQLESSTNYDITETHLQTLQNLRQSRHQRLQQHQQQHESDLQASQENDDFEQLQLQQEQQQQQHSRRHHHRQRRHHHHHHNQHQNQNVEHEHSSKHHIARAHARGQAKARKLHHRHLVEHEQLHTESQ